MLDSLLAFIIIIQPKVGTRALSTPVGSFEEFPAGVKAKYNLKRNIYNVIL